jgi:hypothetical protein
MCTVCGKIQNDLCEREIERLKNWIRNYIRNKYTNVIFDYCFGKDVIIYDDRYKRDRSRLVFLVFQSEETKKQELYGVAGFAYKLDKQGKFEILHKLSDDTVGEWQACW